MNWRSHWISARNQTAASEAPLCGTSLSEWSDFKVLTTSASVFLLLFNFGAIAVIDRRIDNPGLLRAEMIKCSIANNAKE